MEKAIKRYMPIFVLPTLFAFIIGFVIPFILGIGLSFCNFTTVTDATFTGLQNYIDALNDTVFQHAFWYTALFTVASVVVINVASFALAMALTQKLRGTNIFRTVFFMPNLIGGIVLGYIWQLIFNGILVNYSQSISLNEWYGFAGLLILVAWQQIGYMMIIYIAGLQAIPGDVLEAAEIDGASKWTVFVKMVIPLSRSIMAVMVVYSMVAYWNDWFTALIYLRADQAPLPLVLRNILIKSSTSASQSSMVAGGFAELNKLTEMIKFASIIVAAAPMLIVYPFVQKYFEKGFMAGAVKG